MNTATPTLSNRDRAVLRAVASGRCAISASVDHSLVVDGMCVSDQFVPARGGVHGKPTASRTGPTHRNWCGPTRGGVTS